VSGLGRGRVADIITNVLLPYTFALGNITGRCGLAEKALNLYVVYPGGALNSVEKHMVAQFGLGRREVKTAVVRQGLIYIYRNFCILGRCGDCLPGKLESGVNVQA
jgi:hypothetical protein